MRLPWGSLHRIIKLFCNSSKSSLLGCLSPEDRCIAIPIALSSKRFHNICLLEIKDPEDAYPDYSFATIKKIKNNERLLNKGGVVFRKIQTHLLSTEDDLLSILDSFQGYYSSPTIFIDITSLPKRYFCFFIKRMLKDKSIANVIATYTQPALNGYTAEHLAEDPMTCDHLPGFAAPLAPKGNTLVVAVGFESLSIRSLLEVYHDKKKDIKIILSFPSDSPSMRREWDTLRQMTLNEAQDINRDNLEVISLWDAEKVYRTLFRWHRDADGLTLAPFGPKPHSLGMALFAVKHDSGFYYTQPKSYNPNYSKGVGMIWAYVIKWDGVPCYDRKAEII